MYTKCFEFYGQYAQFFDANLFESNDNDVNSGTEQNQIYFPKQWFVKQLDVDNNPHHPLHNALNQNNLYKWVDTDNVHICLLKFQDYGSNTNLTEIIFNKMKDFACIQQNGGINKNLTNIKTKSNKRKSNKRKSNKRKSNKRR